MIRIDIALMTLLIVLVMSLLLFFLHTFLLSVSFPITITGSTFKPSILVSGFPLSLYYKPLCYPLYNP